MANIVLIDESSANRAVLAAALRHAGHHILVADDGDAMLTLSHAPPIDLMIIDVFDAALDGLATLVRLNGQYPDLPLVALSQSRQDLESALEIGGLATLAKPTSATEAIATIDMVLRRVRKRAQSAA